MANLLPSVLCSLFWQLTLAEQVVSLQCLHHPEPSGQVLSLVKH